jgi:hypothetical protein
MTVAEAKAYYSFGPQGTKILRGGVSPMPTTGIVRLCRSQVVKALALALVLLSFASEKAFAAPDWSAIQTAMGASGIEMPGNVLRFELYRSDLSVTVSGQPQALGAVANGFIAFKRAYDGQMFVDGGLPAQESEVNALETALRTNRHIEISAIGSHVVLESPKLVWVEFEALGDGTDLATSLATALTTIHSPQLGVVTIEGVNSVFDPSTILPPKFLKLFDEGFVEQFDLTFSFYLPRPDETSIYIGDVRTEAGLGVGQSFNVQVDFSGGTNVTLDIDFALRPDEVQPVEDTLRAGGFTIASQGNHYVDDNPHLMFVHATGSGDGFALGNTLYSAIQIINASARGH